MLNNNKVAIFVDAENVGNWIKQGGVDQLLEELKALGQIVIRRAYGVWSRPQMAMHQSALNKQGFELIHCYHPVAGKNSADIHMTVDVMECAWQFSNINYFVLVTGDSDFSPVFRRLRAIGKEVIGVGQSSTLSQCIEGTCSKFIYTDACIDVLNKAPELQKIDEVRNSLNPVSSLEEKSETPQSAKSQCLADQYRKLLNRNNYRLVLPETLKIVYKLSHFQNEKFSTLSLLKDAIYKRIEQQGNDISKTDINKVFFLFIRAGLVSTVKDGYGLDSVVVKNLEKSEFLLQMDVAVISRIISLAKADSIELKAKEIKKLTISSISKDYIKELIKSKV